MYSVQEIELFLRVEMPLQIKMKIKMKKPILLILIVFIFSSTYGQHGLSCEHLDKLEYYNNKSNNIIGFVPCKARVTNGWAIGVLPIIGMYCEEMDSIRINGLYTNVSPLHLFITAFGLLATPIAVCIPANYKREQLDSLQVDSISRVRGLTWYEIDSANVKHKANGLILGIYETGKFFEVNGVQITLTEHVMEKLNGFGFAPLYSFYKEFDGFIITGIKNDANKGKGVQIGLFNRSYKMKGIQIGLWNKIGKRGLPLINMSFKD